MAKMNWEKANQAQHQREHPVDNRKAMTRVYSDRARIKAKWPGRCVECDKAIAKGESCLYLFDTRQLMCGHCHATEELYNPAARKRGAVLNYARTALREVPEKERLLVLRQEFRDLTPEQEAEALQACGSG